MNRFDDAPVEEWAVIGGMFTWEGPWPAAVLRLEPEHFRHEHCAKLYMAIDSIRGDVGPVDIVELHHKLRELEYDYLSSEMLKLQNQSPVSCNLDHWAWIISDRHMKAEILRLTRDAVSRGEDAASAAAAANIAVMSMDLHGRDDGLVAVREMLPGVLRDLEQEYDDPNGTLITRTGIAAIDSRAKLRAGQLTVIAARPGMGKSALAGNIAMHSAHGDADGIVALFSLEMHASDFIRRMLSSFARVTPTRLPAMAKSGTLLEACDHLHRLRLYIDDRPRMGIDSMRAALSRFKRTRVVIVDYLQLAKMDNRLERHDLRLGAVTKGLKAISKDFDCHVIALSQLNRGVESREGRRPHMSDLRNSGEIEEDADNIWFIYREGYYNDDDPDDTAEIIMSKQRFGATGIARVAWDARTQTFHDRV